MVVLMLVILMQIILRIIIVVIVIVAGTMLIELVNIVRILLNMLFLWLKLGETCPKGFGCLVLGRYTYS